MIFVDVTPFDAQEPDQLLECECGERFWTTPCGEENLMWSDIKKSLVAVCPKCGVIDEPVEKGK